MTFDDLLAVERHVADVCAAMGLNMLPPCFLTEELRVEIDLSGRDADQDRFADLLLQSLGSKGYRFDVWQHGSTVCVDNAAERGDA